MNKDLSVFEKDSIPKAVFKLALPTIASMLVSIVYNMVDTFFVAKLNDANMVAAVSIATPVFLFLMALGNVFGVGGSTFISRALGEKRFDKVKIISSFCFWAGIAASLVGTAIFIFGMKGILKMIHASSATAPFAKNYLSILAYGAPLIVIGGAFSNIIRGEGSATVSMAGMMAGTIVNIILDPIMIIAMKMGVEGAAVATVIGNGVTCVVYIIHILKGKSILSINPKNYKMGEKIATTVVSIGIPASLNNVLMSVSHIFLNNFLSGYGDIPVASMGIAMKANMLVVFLQLGMGIGIQPLVGYNFGARNFVRMNKVIRFSIFCNLFIGVLMTTLYLIFANDVVRFFMNDDQVVLYGVKMLRALMISGPVLGIMFIMNFSFQAMGKALAALVVSISRQGFVFMPLLFISSAIAGLNGIIYAQPLADLISVLLSVLMFIFIMNRIKKTTNEVITEQPAVLD